MVMTNEKKILFSRSLCKSPVKRRVQAYMLTVCQMFVSDDEEEKDHVKASL